MTVLMVAMPKEIKSLVGERKPDEVTCGVSFYNLGEDLVACCGGVGKVNAAMATQVAIDRHFPDLIINVGLAGCFEEVPIGTIVLCESFLQHDVDTTGCGDPIGMVSTVNMVEFPASGLPTAQRAMDATGLPYRVGKCATGDWFGVMGQRAEFIKDTFHPLVCEMEGAAIAQVCYRNRVPFMAIKSVSDCLTASQNYYFDYPKALEHLNHVAIAFIKAMEEF